MKDLPKGLNKLGLKNKASGIIINNLEKSFADRFPKAFKVYYILKTGSRRFAEETKTFVAVKRSLSSRDQLKAVSDLKWNDVNIYREIPKDWKAVAPVIIIASFPLLNYVILPLALSR